MQISDAKSTGPADHPRPILQYLRPSTVTDGAGAIKLKTGPVIGYVNIPDTTALLRFLAFDKEQSLLPDNAKLVLSLSPITTGERAFEILAIKDDSLSNLAIAIRKNLVKDVVINDRKNKPVELQILFTEAGQYQMDVLARHNSGKNIAVLLDGRVISYPVIKQKEGNSSLSLTDHWDKAEATALAALFRSEPLPVPLRILSLKNEELQH
jgi:preprotein translocase subunit SecD